MELFEQVRTTCSSDRLVPKKDAKTATAVTDPGEHDTSPERHPVAVNRAPLQSAARREQAHRFRHPCRGRSLVICHQSEGQRVD